MIYRIVLLAAVLVSFQASAQSTKPVEVVNFPDPQKVAGAVEVTNLPEVQDVNVVGGPASSCEVKRFQLVGYTVVTTTGAMGGPWGASAMCQAKFPGSRMRVWTEAVETPTPPAIRPPLAWMNFEGDLFGRGQVEIGEVSYSCSAWTSVRPDGGSVDVGIAVTDQALRVSSSCDADLPIACCAQ